MEIGSKETPSQEPSTPAAAASTTASASAGGVSHTRSSSYPDQGEIMKTPSAPKTTPSQVCIIILFVYVIGWSQVQLGKNSLLFGEIEVNFFSLAIKQVIFPCIHLPFNNIGEQIILASFSM